MKYKAHAKMLCNRCGREIALVIHVMKDSADLLLCDKCMEGLVKEILVDSAEKV